MIVSGVACKGGLGRSYFSLLLKSLEYLVVLAIVVGLLLFILWPIAAVLFQSVYSDGELTLRLFRQLVPGYSRYFFNSILVAVLSTALALIIAVCIAIYESYSRSRFKKWIMPLLLLTMISPPFVSSLAYISLFGRRGLITNALLGLSINPYGWHGVVVMQALAEISFSAVLIIGVLRGIDGNLLQASRDLGACGWETLRRIVFPLLLPGIKAAGFIAFVKSLADFGTPIVIGGNFSVLATEAYLMVISRGDLSKAAVISMLILLPALLALMLCRGMGKSLVPSNLSGIKATGREPELRLGSTLERVLGLVTWLFFALMLLQFSVIVLTAFSRYQSGGYVFTTEYLGTLNDALWSSVLRSAWYSFIAGIIASVFGTLLAYYIDRRGLWGGKVIDFIAALPYVIPGTLFGIGYVLAFHAGPLEITGTAAIVVINCIYRQITVAAKAGSAALINVSPEIENAARDLGVQRLYIIKDIIFPLLKPAILVGFVNTFTATMMTIGSIIFIISPNAKVATIELFGLLNQGHYGEAAVVAVVLTVLTLAVNVVFSRFLLVASKMEEKGASHVAP